MQAGWLVRIAGLAALLLAGLARADAAFLVEALPAEVGDAPAAFERFAREASLLASLAHPGIVRYLGHGESEHGQRWLRSHLCRSGGSGDVLLGTRQHGTGRRRLHG